MRRTTRRACVRAGQETKKIISDYAIWRRNFRGSTANRHPKCLIMCKKRCACKFAHRHFFLCTNIDEINDPPLSTAGIDTRQFRNSGLGFRVTMSVASTTSLGLCHDVSRGCAPQLAPMAQSTVDGIVCLYASWITSVGSTNESCQVDNIPCLTVAQASLVLSWKRRRCVDRFRESSNPIRSPQEGSYSGMS